MEAYIELLSNMTRPTHKRADRDCSLVRRHGGMLTLIRAVEYSDTRSVRAIACQAMRLVLTLISSLIIDLKIIKQFNSISSILMKVTLPRTIIRRILDATTVETSSSSISETMPRIVNSIAWMACISRFFNTPDRLGSLFRRLSDRVVRSCKRCVYGA